MTRHPRRVCARLVRQPRVLARLVTEPGLWRRFRDAYADRWAFGQV